MKLFLSLEELAQLTSSEVHGDGSHIIQGVESLENASSSDVSFLENPRYEQKMRFSKAGALFIPPHITREVNKNYLVTINPSAAFQKAIEFFQKPALSGFSGIHPTAIIHHEARIEKNVSIGPYTVIDRAVMIGEGSIIGAHTYIGPECIIGKNCLFYSHVSIHDRSQIGNRVILQYGCVIGSSGFGYITDNATGKHSHLQQLGIVCIEDDVEIGAHTTIDRARFQMTRIRRGTKIDNLVQIAHQVDVGEDNLIVSQVGIAGSTKTGKNVVIAGQAGIVGHITIGDGVILSARSAPIKSILEAGVYGGAPATPIREFNEQMVLLRNIKKIISRIEALEKSQE